MKRPSDYLKDPIYFHRQFVEFTESITAALMLSRGLHWSRYTADPEGWFYKSREEWNRETGMTRCEQEGARKRLRELGVWHENWEQKTNRMWFRIDKDQLDELLASEGSAENPPTPRGVGGKPAEGSAENQPPHYSTIKTAQKTGAENPSENHLLIQQPSQSPASPKPPAPKKTPPAPSLSMLFMIDGFSAEWGCFVQHRKKLKKPLTDRAEQIILKKLEQKPQRAIEALQKCMEKGWQSFEWHYLDEQPRQNGSAAFTPPKQVRMSMQ